MPDYVVIALILIGPLGIWALMRFMKPKGSPPVPPED